MNKEIYALEEYKDNDCPTIFLAGPTPRDHSSPSWRPDMIKILRDSGFTGDIFIPEKKGDYLSYEYGTHTRWEVEHLNKCDALLFWVPREINSMPAFTTNIEFGEFLHTGRIVLGYPEWAERMRYFKERCIMHDVPYFHTMEETAKCAIQQSNFSFNLTKALLR